MLCGQTRAATDAASPTAISSAPALQNKMQKSRRKLMGSDALQQRAHQSHHNYIEFWGGVQYTYAFFDFRDTECRAIMRHSQ